MTEPALKLADRVEVTILVDNYLDIFVQSSTSVDHRLPFNPDLHLLAEHGFSCLITVYSGQTEHTILLDTGFSRECMAWNSYQLGISLATIEAVVLSHGHFDHTGGLERFFSVAEQQVPLIAHPDAFLRRRLNNPVQGPVELPQIDTTELKKAGKEILMQSGPSTLAEDLLLVTGEVERKTPFEKGMPGMEMYSNGSWVSDPIRDDQAIVINVKEKGLVILSGCAHAGIINTVEYARKITGIDHVYAVLGGFHLTGPAFASIIQPTINAMKGIDPDYIIPMHCTGWNAINRFMIEIPGKCILNTVGTTYVL